MQFPDNVVYTKEHEWVRQEGDLLVIGISDHAQSELGDIVFVELPAIGAALTRAESFGVVESVKTASDLYCPVSGAVVAINEALEEAPEKVNQDPYGEGWMLKIKPSSWEADQTDLLSSADYRTLVEG